MLNIIKIYIETAFVSIHKFSHFSLLILPYIPRGGEVNKQLCCFAACWVKPQNRARALLLAGALLSPISAAASAMQTIAGETLEAPAAPALPPSCSSRCAWAGHTLSSTSLHSGSRLVKAFVNTKVK